MSELTVAATNTTEPTPVATEPTPAAGTPVADGGNPAEPASSEGTLLSEGKPAEGEPKPAEPKAPEPAKPEGAPEKYEFTEAGKYDATILGTFSEAAKEANLTQDAAQKFLEKVAPAVQARTDEQVKAVHQQWTEASTADKEFGGEKLKENLGVAQKALKTFGSPELRTFLESTGLGNHPEVIRLLYKAGKAISEDGFVSGSASGNKAKTIVDVLYDNTIKKE